MKAIEEAKERGRHMIDREAKVPLTARAVELFQRALAIKAGGNTRRREFLDLQLALHRELNLQPLHPFPLDLEADQPPPPWMTDAYQIVCWNHAADIRRHLDAAAAR
jgi:hypothetical protein